MSEQTPLQRLDEAVHEFVAAIGDEGTLNGWALTYQTSFVDGSDPTMDPLQWDHGYAVAPGTSPFAAIGLAEHLAAVIRNVYLTGDDA